MQRGSTNTRRSSDPTISPSPATQASHASTRMGSGRLKDLPSMPEPKGGRRPLPVSPALPAVAPSSAAESMTNDQGAEDIPVEQLLQAQAQQKRNEMARIYHALGQDCMMRAPSMSHSFLLRALAVAQREGPELIEILSTLGNCCIQEENGQDAVRYLKRALEGARTLSSVAHARILLNLCAALNKLGQHEEALQKADEAVELLHKPTPRVGVDVELRSGKGKKVLLVTAAYQSAACHEYLGNRSAALKCVERGLSLASDAGLPPEDELVVRLRGSKKDLSKPVGDGKPVPPKQTKPPTDPPPAAEIEATAAVVAELVDAKARHEVQALLARQSAKEAVASKESVMSRSIDEEAQLREAKTEAEARLGEAQVALAEAIERLQAERAEAEVRLQQAVQEVEAAEGAKVRLIQFELQEAIASEAESKAELQATRLELEEAKAQLQRSVDEAREMGRRYAEQTEMRQVEEMARRSEVVSGCLSNEVRSMEAEVKIEVEKRVRAELDAEQSYARCEAVAGEATAEAERKDAQRKQAEEALALAQASAREAEAQLREEMRRHEQMLRDQLAAENSQLTEQLREQLAAQVSESAQLLSAAVAERDAALAAVATAQVSAAASERALQQLREQWRSDAQKAEASLNEAQQAAQKQHAMAVEALNAEWVARLEVEHAAHDALAREDVEWGRKLEEQQTAAAENLSAALTNESIARAGALAELRTAHESAIDDLSRQLAAAISEVNTLREAEAKAELRTREVKEAAEEEAQQALLKAQREMESLHELAMAEAADAHAQELDRIRMRKESDVLEAQRAAVAEAEARGKAEQELDNFRAEVEAARKTAAAAVAEQTVAIERERKGREAALVEAKKAFCIAAAEEVDGVKRERDAAVAAERAASDEAMRLADEGHEAAVGSLKAAFTSELAAAREHSAQLETKLADLEEKLRFRELALANALGDANTVDEMLTQAQLQLGEALAAVGVEAKPGSAIQIQRVALAAKRQQDAAVQAQAAAEGAREALRAATMEAAKREAVLQGSLKAGQYYRPSDLLSSKSSASTGGAPLSGRTTSGFSGSQGARQDSLQSNSNEKRQSAERRERKVTKRNSNLDPAQKPNEGVMKKR